MSSKTDRNEVAGQVDTTDERHSGSEWDSTPVENERIDDRDAENIDLDIECWNAALERKARV